MTTENKPVQKSLGPEMQDDVSVIEALEKKRKLQEEFEAGNRMAAFRCRNCEKEFGWPSEDKTVVFNTPWEETGFEISFCSNECRRAFLFEGDFRYNTCAECGRFICIRNSRNGHHVQFRDHKMRHVCLKCYEKSVLEDGIPAEEFEKHVPGMFFSGDNHEPLKAGYEIVEGFDDVLVDCGRKSKVQEKALALIEDGYKVVVGWERMSIMGDEGYITLFAKRGNNRRKAIKKSDIEFLWAMKKARDWAAERALENIVAANALAYIGAFDKAVEEGDKGGKTQLLYILNNLKGWRGEVARKAKEILKEASK